MLLFQEIDWMVDAGCRSSYAAAIRDECGMNSYDRAIFSFVPPEIRNGNLKSILGLFFILSRYKQQQQQQQQYYQSLVELSQQTSSAAPSSSSHKTQEMQSRYATLQKLHVVLIW